MLCHGSKAPGNYQLRTQWTFARSIKIKLNLKSLALSFQNGELDDLDPISQEPNIDLVMLSAGNVPGDAGLVIIPGTKSTIEDLKFTPTKVGS